MQLQIVIIWMMTLFLAFSAYHVSGFATKEIRRFRPSTRYLVTESVPEIVEQSYTIAFSCAALFGSSLILQAQPTQKAIIASVFAFLTFYVSSKTDSIRFKFDEEAFSLVQKDGSSVGGNPLFPNQGDNGDYRWNYKNIVNYCFLPRSEFPIFLYFKEVEVPENFRIEPPFYIDSIPGQVHLFPIIGNQAQLENGFKRHSCNKIVEKELVIKRQEDVKQLLKGLQLI
jgi:hypothetical protein